MLAMVVSKTFRHDHCKRFSKSSSVPAFVMEACWAPSRPTALVSENLILETNLKVSVNLLKNVINCVAPKLCIPRSSWLHLYMSVDRNDKRWSQFPVQCVCVCVRACAFVCACVREREKERERGGGETKE